MSDQSDREDGEPFPPEPGPIDTPQPEPVGEPEPELPTQYRLRRAPRYRSFGLTGVVLGAVIGLVLAFSKPATGDYSAQTIAGYFAVSCALVGGLAGLAAALLLERRRS